jgi:hypothetical protein
VYSGKDVEGYYPIDSTAVRDLTRELPSHLPTLMDASRLSLKGVPGCQWSKCWTSGKPSISRSEQFSCRCWLVSWTSSLLF